MTDRSSPASAAHRPAPLARAGFACALMLAASLASPAAQALTVNYQCVGYRPLQAELNPRNGHVQFEGQDWRVVRVPGGREARYVNAKAGVTVTTYQREMTLVHGGETLKCYLRSDALQQFEPASAPKR
jgi:hypothetical protein